MGMPFLNLHDFLSNPKDPDPSRKFVGLRVPIPSEKNRNVGGPIPSLGHAWILREICQMMKILAAIALFEIPDTQWDC